MIDIGVARPERAGAGDDQHRDRGDQRVGEARLRPEQRPGDEGQRRATAITAGTNQPATRSARRWIGARLRCASATICTICASIVSRADLLGAHDEAAGAVERAADHLVARLPCSTGIGLAGHHRLVDGARALEDHAVDRHLLARPHAQPVADRDLRRAARPPRRRRRDAPRGLRRQVEQRADRAATVRSRARSSSTWPSSTSTVMTAAASK